MCVCVCVCVCGREPKCATAVCAYGLVIMIVYPHSRCLAMTRDERSVCYHCPPTDIWLAICSDGLFTIANNVQYPYSFLREIYSRYDRKKESCERRKVKQRFIKSEIRNSKNVISKLHNVSFSLLTHH